MIIIIGRIYHILSSIDQTLCMYLRIGIVYCHFECHIEVEKCTKPITQGKPSKPAVEDSGSLTTNY